MSFDADEEDLARREAAEAVQELLGLLKPLTEAGQAYTCSRHGMRIDEICRRAGVQRHHRAVGGIAVDPHGYPLVYWDMREVQARLAIVNRGATGAIANVIELRGLAQALRAAVNEMSADVRAQPYSVWSVLAASVRKMFGLAEAAVRPPPEVESV